MTHGCTRLALGGAGTPCVLDTGVRWTTKLDYLLAFANSAAPFCCESNYECAADARCLVYLSLTEYYRKPCAKYSPSTLSRTHKQRPTRCIAVHASKSTNNNISRKSYEGPQVPPRILSFPAKEKVSEQKSQPLLHYSQSKDCFTPHNCFLSSASASCFSFDKLPEHDGFDAVLRPPGQDAEEIYAEQSRHFRRASEQVELVHDSEARLEARVTSRQ